MRSVDAIATDWEELAGRVRAAPFLRPGWVGAWWRAFGTGRLEIVTLRRGDRLAALIPLHRRLGRVRSTSNWHTAHFGLLAEDPDAARELVAALFARQPIELALGFVDGARPEVAMYRDTATSMGYRILERTLERSPYLDVDGTWEAFTRTLSRNRRSQVGRRRRRLEELGRLELDIVDGRERLEELLAEVFRVEGSRWKTTSGTAMASRPETRRFYEEVARWATERGWLRLAFLRLDGRPLAVQYLLEADGVQYALKGGYDRGFDRYSPGVLILLSLLERAFSTEVKRFEMGGGDEDYKTAFARGHHDLILLQAFAPSVAGMALWAVYAYGRPLAKRAQAAYQRMKRKAPRTVRVDHRKADG
jgi:CelD/BcsL family acetyltransferase involved in cellulose biosynthesis